MFRGRTSNPTGPRRVLRIRSSSERTARSPPSRPRPSSALARWMASSVRTVAPAKGSRARARTDSLIASCVQSGRGGADAGAQLGSHAVREPALGMEAEERAVALDERELEERKRFAPASSEPVSSCPCLTQQPREDPRSRRRRDSTTVARAPRRATDRSPRERFPERWWGRRDRGGWARLAWRGPVGSSAPEPGHPGLFSNARGPGGPSTATTSPRSVISTCSPLSHQAHDLSCQAGPSLRGCRQSSWHDRSHMWLHPTTEYNPRPS